MSRTKIFLSAGGSSCSAKEAIRVMSTRTNVTGWSLSGLFTGIMKAGKGHFFLTFPGWSWLAWLPFWGVVPIECVSGGGIPVPECCPGAEELW